MTEWLTHPAFQSGVAPFVSASLMLLGAYRSRWIGLCVTAGFVTVVALAVGFSFEPLTASRKLVLLVVAAAALGAASDLAVKRARWHTLALTLLAGAGAVWMVAGVLRQQDAARVMLYAAGSSAYFIWLVISVNAQQADSLRAGAGGLALGVASGGAAILGASALLGQMGIALGAACTAYLLAQFVAGRRLACGRIFTLPVAVLSAAIGVAGVLLGQLPWYALPLLAVLPFVAAIPLPAITRLRLELALRVAMATGAAAMSLLIIWRTVADGSV